MASVNACWMLTLGAPSPGWQQGAVTTTVIGVPDLPSLLTLTTATPPPTAFNNTLGPVGWRLTTRLFEVLQVTWRSVSSTPLGAYSVTRSVSVSPRFSRAGLADGVTAIVLTGMRTSAPPPGVYSTEPPSNVCRSRPSGRASGSEFGKPRKPACASLAA